MGCVLLCCIFCFGLVFFPKQYAFTHRLSEQPIFLASELEAQKSSALGQTNFFCISVNSVYSKLINHLSLSLPLLPGKRSAVALFTKGVLGKSS